MNLDAALSHADGVCPPGVLLAALARHGDFPAWRDAYAALPALIPTRIDLGDCVTIGTADDCSGPERECLITALQAFHPWRKGPFALFGIPIDTEWRSDWKWARVAPHIGALAGRRVLDVGCGNGYFGWRMLQAGAATVVGIDPMPAYLMQHLAIHTYIARGGGPTSNYLLPLKFEDLPAMAPFDLVVSMGVLYHRREPVAHLRALRDRAGTDAAVVVETLIVRTGPTLVAPQRYARMRNVHAVPDVATLERWFETAGYRSARVVDVTPTTISEQRSTTWMTFESLASALDATDPNRTVEGHPAPVRAVVVALP
jgi:tRNA (mo5U34)-methyltransferase